MNHMQEFFKQVTDSINQNPMEASAAGILVVIFTKFIEGFKFLHVPDVIVPTLQVLVLTLSIVFYVKAIKKKNKEKDDNG